MDVLFLIDGEHDTVGITQLTVSIYSVEYSLKSFREVSEVEGEPNIDSTFLLIW